MGPEVLVPRPETEELVERGLEHLKTFNGSAPRVLDLATGSGCLLIALLKNHAGATGLGVDISEAALNLARANSETLGVTKQVRWLVTDLSQEWPQEMTGPFDLITANHLLTHEQV